MNNNMKKRTVSALVSLAMIFTAVTVPAEAKNVGVKEGVAAYIGGNIEMNGGAIIGDAYLGGFFEATAGSIEGTIYKAQEDLEINLPDGQNTNIDTDETLQFPESILQPGAAPDVPKAEPENFEFSWWPEKTISESGSYRNITANNVMHIDTSKGDVVLVTNGLELKNSIWIDGEHDVILYVNNTVHFTEGKVTSPNGGKLHIIVKNGDFTVSGAASLKGNVYVPKGSISLEGSGKIEGLVATGGNVSLSGDSSVNGVIHAPRGAVTLSGSGSVYGSVIAEKLFLSWGTKVAYQSSKIDVLPSVPGEINYPVRGNEPEPTQTVTPGPTATASPGVTSEPTATATASPEVTPEPTQTPSMPPSDTPEDVILPEEAAPGLKAEYYSYFDDGKMEFPSGKMMMVRREDNIRMNWEWGAPDTEVSRIDRFSMRATGFLVPKETGDYTFTTWSDDGVRLVVGGVEVVNRWEDMALSCTEGKTLRLEAGKAYPLELDYYENTEVATLHLFWTKDGNMEIIPPECFYMPQWIPEKELWNQRQNGLKARYYNDPELARQASEDTSIKPALQNLETVDLWTQRSPYSGKVQEDYFSVWYEGYLEAPKTGTMKLEFIADDGIQVKLNNEMVVDEWHENSTDHVYSVELDVVAGELYPVTIFYQEQTGLAACQMLWSMDGIERQLVPVQYLYSDDPQ